MVVGICDADEQEHTNLTRLCNECGSHVDLHYYCGKELLHAKNLPELLFLNIRLPDVDSVELMRKFEFFFPSPYIIFYTFRKEQSMKAYGKNVLGFLDRPIAGNDVKRCLQHAQSLLSMEGYLVLKDNNKVFYNEIRYIEGSKNYSIFHTVGENVVLSRITMKELADSLPACFSRIHKSFIVNFYHAVQISKNNFVLDNKEKTALPISRKNKKVIEKEYFDFLFKCR